MDNRHNNQFNVSEVSNFIFDFAANKLLFISEQLAEVLYLTYALLDYI